LLPKLNFFVIPRLFWQGPDFVGFPFSGFEKGLGLVVTLIEE
jgi:hypothetical protein